MARSALPRPQGRRGAPLAAPGDDEEPEPVAVVVHLVPPGREAPSTRLPLGPPRWPMACIIRAIIRTHPAMGTRTPTLAPLASRTPPTTSIGAHMAMCMAWGFRWCFIGTPIVRSRSGRRSLTPPGASVAKTRSESGRTTDSTGDDRSADDAPSCAFGRRRREIRIRPPGGAVAIRGTTESDGGVTRFARGVAGPTVRTQATGMARRRAPPRSRTALHFQPADGRRLRPGRRPHAALRDDHELAVRHSRRMAPAGALRRWLRRSYGPGQRRNADAKAGRGS